jgi:hypothetical protein
MVPGYGLWTCRPGYLFEVVSVVSVDLEITSFDPFEGESSSSGNLKITTEQRS